MRNSMKGSWLLGCMAAIVFMGTTQASAFQQPEERPLIIQPEAENEAARQNTQTGEFTSQHQGTITITSEGENPRSFQTAEQTQVTIDGQPARLQDLQKGDQIRITTGLNDVALRIQATRQRGDNQEARPEAGERQEARPETRERRETRFRGETEEQPNRRQAEQTETRRNQGGTAWLGVMLRETEGEQGVEVVRTYPSGPASRAGVYSGDVLLQIDSKQVSSPQDVNQIIQQAEPTEQIELVVQRDDQKHTLPVTLGDRRAFLGEEQRPIREPAGGEDAFDDQYDSLIPDHAMMLEQHRHFAQQHQRIEEKLDQVLKEMEELRNQLGQRQGAQQNNPRTRPQPDERR